MSEENEWERQFEIAKQMLASRCDLCGVVHSALDGCWVAGSEPTTPADPGTPAPTDPATAARSDRT